MFLKSYQFAIKWSRWIQNTPKVWCFSSGQPRLRCDVRLKMIGGNQDHWDRPFWAFLTLSSWAFAELNFSSWIRSWWVYCVWRKLSVQECHVNIQSTKKLAPCFLRMESDRIGRSEVHFLRRSCPWTVHVRYFFWNLWTSGPLWWFICIFKTILSRWWFHFFYFPPFLGEDSLFDIFWLIFFKWLKPPTSYSYC